MPAGTEARRRAKKPALGRAAPPKAAKHHKSGTKLLARGRFAEAAEEFRAALKLLPDSARLSYDLAVALERSGQGEEAIKWYDRYLSLAPGGKRVSEVLRAVTALKEAVREEKEQARRKAEGEARLLREWADARVREEMAAEAAAEAARRAAQEAARREAEAAAEAAAAAAEGEGSPWWLVPLTSAVVVASAATWAGLTAWDRAEEATRTAGAGPYADARESAGDAATRSTRFWLGAGVLIAASGVLLVAGTF